MRIKILIVENKRRFPSAVCSRLREAGFETDTVSYMQYCKNKELYALYALIIYVAKEDAAGQFRRPVLYVLEQSTLPQKVNSFRMGTEDYIVEPINVTELFLRIQMLLRFGYTIKVQRF